MTFHFNPSYGLEALSSGMHNFGTKHPLDWQFSPPVMALDLCWFVIDCDPPSMISPKPEAARDLIVCARQCVSWRIGICVCRVLTYV